MTSALRSFVLLWVVVLLVGCEGGADQNLAKACGVAPTDATSVAIWPRDMVTHAPRVLGWDDAAKNVVAGRVNLQVRFHNYARPPSEGEIEDVLSRTELLTWPEGEPLTFTTKSATPGDRTSLTVDVVATEALPDGWYALRISERAGFTAEDASPRGPGRGQLSRFHVGSCPLVLAIESVSGSGVTRVLLSETLEASSLRSFGVTSLDAESLCVPAFSTEGPQSPGKNLAFFCNFDIAARGVKVFRDPASRILLPRGAEFRSEDFRHMRGSIQRTQLALSPTEPMPNCNP